MRDPPRLVSLCKPVDNNDLDDKWEAGYLGHLNDLVMPKGPPFVPVEGRVVCLVKVEPTLHSSQSFKSSSLPSLHTSIPPVSDMDTISLSNLAMRHLGAYVPFLQSGVTSESWFAPLIEWGIRIAVVGLFASAFKTGRSKHGLWESIRIGEWSNIKDC